METGIIDFSYNETGNGYSALSLLTEDVWKNAHGIQALFIVNSSGKILYSKFSKYFDNLNPAQLSQIISSSRSSFAVSTETNPMRLAISIFDKYTSMTSKVGEQFMVMILPNNTSVGSSVQFAESFRS